MILRALGVFGLFWGVVSLFGVSRLEFAVFCFFESFSYIFFLNYESYLIYVIITNLLIEKMYH